MKKSTSLFATALCAFVLFGCSTSTPSTTLPDPVTETCTSSETGVTISYKFTAPAQNQDITQMGISIDLTLADLGLAQEDLDQITEEDLQSFTDSLKEMYTQLLNTMYGISPDDITVKTTNTNMTLNVFISDLSAFEANASDDQKEALSHFFGGTYVFKDAITSIEEQGFTCE